MPFTGTSPLRFKPRSVSDSLDGTNSPPGSCRALTNLIFDPSTPNTLQCRPAAAVINSFSGFSSPGVVSIAFELGGRIYGMVATSRNSGKDEPFVYDIASNTFITVSGVTGAKCPTTQATTGEWSPPTMDSIGVYVILTHPGYTGSANKIGWFDITNPAAPSWNAGDTATNGLGGVPNSVVAFNSRAYFSVGNSIPFTDVLTLTRTNANQVLTAGDSSPINAMAPFPLNTTTQGILQGVLAFKDGIIFQITGDSALSTLAINSLGAHSGTRAPRSIQPTPAGVRYIDDDGLRTIDYAGNVLEPDSDVRVPFMKAGVFSRISSSYNNGIYRICVQNTTVNGSPFQEFWYDDIRGGWTGPHNFRQDMAVAYESTFICFSNDNPGKIYQSDPVQNAASSFTENGTALQFFYTTSPLAKPNALFANSAVLSTINLAFLGSGVYSVVGLDESGGLLAQANVMTPSSLTLWGSFIWGVDSWFGQQFGLKPFNIAWSNPLVFTKLVVQINGACNLGFKISNLEILYKPLSYIP